MKPQVCSKWRDVIMSGIHDAAKSLYVFIVSQMGFAMDHIGDKFCFVTLLWRRLFTSELHEDILSLCL